jgi:HD-like signal output (HDOD) protein
MTIFSKADFANSDALRAAAERAIAENKLPTPALPHAVQKLIELTRRPMASFDEAVTVLAGAPLLAGRIARRVRMGIVGQGTSPGTPAGEPPKPMTGPSKRPDARELKQIALRLGLIGLRDLAYELSAGALIFHAPGARDSMRVLRRHSLVVAHLSRIICKHISIDVDEPFMAGLLHDAGWGLVLREVCRSDEPPSNLIPLISAMDAVHIAATRRLAKDWLLSADAQASIELHHEPDLAKAPPVAAVIALAQDLSIPWVRGLDKSQLSANAQMLATWTCDAIPVGQRESARQRLRIDTEAWRRISLAATTLDPRRIMGS